MAYQSLSKLTTNNSGNGLSKYIVSNRSSPFMSPSCLSGLIAYWAFEDQSWSDSTGNGYTLINSGTTLGTGILNKCAFFSNNSFLYNTSSFPLSGDFSISLWFNATSLPSAASEIITNPNSGIGGIGIQLNANGAGIGLNSPNVSNVNVSSYNFKINTWYHIVITRSSNVVRCYVNSISQNTNFTTNYNYSGPIAFGWDNSNTGFNFNGSIDEVGIWNRALSQYEIANIYNNGAGSVYIGLLQNLLSYFSFDEITGTRYDSGANGLDLDKQYGTVSYDQGILGNAALFSSGGANGALYSTKNLSLKKNPFSYSVWFKWSGSFVNAGDGPSLLATRQSDQTLDDRWSFGFDATYGLICHYANGIVVSYALNPVPNTWYHAVVVKSSDAVNGYSLYINGNLVATGTENYGSNGYTDLPLVIGGFPVLYFQKPTFNGLIDEIGIWNRALSQAEITNLYNMNNGGQGYPLTTQVFNKSTVTSNIKLISIPNSMSLDSILSSCVMWIDVSDASTLTLNGNLVSNIADKSNNNAGFTQSNPSNQPQYYPNGFISRRPSIRFTAASTYNDANAKYMLNDNGLYFANYSGPFSFFAICAQNTANVSVNAVINIFSGSSNSAFRRKLQISFDSSAGTFSVSNGPVDGNGYSFSLPKTNTNYGYYMVTVPSITAQNCYFGSLNALKGNNGTVSFGTTTNTQFSMGTTEGFGDPPYHGEATGDGEISVLMMFNRELTFSEYIYLFSYYYNIFNI
jgi:hypothetical protein